MTICTRCLETYCDWGEVGLCEQCADQPKKIKAWIGGLPFLRIAKDVTDGYELDQEDDLSRDIWP